MRSRAEFPNRLPCPPGPPPRGRGFGRGLGLRRGGRPRRRRSRRRGRRKIRYRAACRPADRGGRAQRMALAVAHQRKAAREHAVIGKSGEQLSGARARDRRGARDSSAGASLPRLAKATTISLRARQPQLQQPRRQLGGDAGELGAMQLRIGVQRARQPLRQVSSRWRGSASNSSAAGSARAAARNSVRRCSMPRCQEASCARASAAISRQQLGAHRHRHFGGGGRRRRAPVGGEIDQRDVGLVADRGDERDHARRPPPAPRSPR